MNSLTNILEICSTFSQTYLKFYAVVFRNFISHYPILGASAISQAVAVPTPLVVNAVPTAPVIPNLQIAAPVIDAPSTSQSITRINVRNEDAVRAEILWCLFMIENHFSYHSCENLGKIFKLMFPNVKAVEDFHLGYNKAAYNVIYGIAPYAKEEVINKLREVDCFTVSFDESLNTVTQNCQMDLQISFWNKTSNMVEVRYFGSQFLGHPTAENLVEAFRQATAGVSLRKLLHLSMDGPAVNFKFFELISKALSLDPSDPLPIDIGSCSLHTIHNSLRRGICASDWPLETLMRAAYFLFKVCVFHMVYVITYSNSLYMQNGESDISLWGLFSTFWPLGVFLKLRKILI